MPECSNPTCLSVLYTEEGRGEGKGREGAKEAPGMLDICVRLTTSQPPLMRNTVSVAKVEQRGSKRAALGPDLPALR